MVYVFRQLSARLKLVFEHFNIHYCTSCQMVMEFSDSVMDVDTQEINTSHWKQFSEVSGFNSA